MSYVYRRFQERDLAFYLLDVFISFDVGVIAAKSKHNRRGSKALMDTVVNKLQSVCPDGFLQCNWPLFHETLWDTKN
jgi:hypothetical protein